MPPLSPGITNEKSVAVTLANTALAMGSGTLRVFATPAMIALCEGCCAESIEDLLDEGMTSVGIKVDIEHIAASPLGASILCKSRLITVDGRRLDFEVEVYDNADLIGKGRHTRFIVDADRFVNKTYSKLQ
ncbi:MAG: thioesterase family protein [Ruminococcus sp.]|uniref:thioesterase family protein n=1 Tax=Ruminococcus sp. TaxID=41978 RepID=UPI002873CD96|nr:thioesterase family protein [Ruminococcus sp.]MBQ3284882.1 thioesterase family protein [Ruminococcus sp.]